MGIVEGTQVLWLCRVGRSDLTSFHRKICLTQTAARDENIIYNYDQQCGRRSRKCRVLQLGTSSVMSGLTFAGRCRFGAIVCLIVTANTQSKNIVVGVRQER